MVKAELQLFEAACRVGEHSYYHLISGVDLPLHTQDYIHEFCLNNQGKLFIEVTNPTEARRITNTQYNFLIKYQKNKNWLIKKIYRVVVELTLDIQHALGIVREDGKTWMHGSQWCSVTHDFATNLVANKRLILNRFKRSNCPDEIYKSTIAYQPEFADRIYELHAEFDSMLRDIDWERGNPYVWRETDYDYLIHSHRLFARKFDENIDSRIIDLICDHITKK